MPRYFNSSRLRNILYMTLISWSEVSSNRPLLWVKNQLFSKLRTYVTSTYDILYTILIELVIYFCLVDRSYWLSTPEILVSNFSLLNFFPSNLKILLVHQKPWKLHRYWLLYLWFQYSEPTSLFHRTRRNYVKCLIDELIN